MRHMLEQPYREVGHRTSRVRSLWETATTTVRFSGIWDANSPTRVTDAYRASSWIGAAGIPSRRSPPSRAIVEPPLY